MSLMNNDAGMVMPVSPMSGGYNDGMYGGGGFFWLLVIFVIAAMGNGFGGFGNNGATNVLNNDVQRGFDQQATMGAINGLGANINALTQAQTQGFANAEIAANNRQMNSMQQLNQLSSQFADCCCENRLAVANVSAEIAREAASTRAAGQANTQSILDKLCQLELDGVKQNYENRISGMQNQIDSLRAQVQDATNAASQTAQTARILADNAAQTAALEQYLNPTPIPAYTVQNPNCCSNRFAFNG